jgi:hypothetical protein
MTVRLASRGADGIHCRRDRDYDGKSSEEGLVGGILISQVAMQTIQIGGLLLNQLLSIAGELLRGFRCFLDSGDIRQSIIGPEDDSCCGQGIEPVAFVFPVEVPLAVGHAGIDLFHTATLIDQEATQSVALIAAIFKAEYQAPALFVGQCPCLGPQGAMASLRVVKGFIEHDLLWKVDGDDIQALSMGINAHGEHLIKCKWLTHGNRLRLDWAAPRETATTSSAVPSGETKYQHSCCNFLTSLRWRNTGMRRQSRLGLTLAGILLALPHLACILPYGLTDDNILGILAVTSHRHVI